MSRLPINPVSTIATNGMTKLEKKIGMDNLKIFWIDDLGVMLKISFILVKFDNKLFI
ncbi:hypothetical protein OA321_03580 [Pelagibacteraceae bacterium]|nr:hypothetical protein [Pelagibacteraceae bacterium]